VKLSIFSENFHKIFMLAKLHEIFTPLVTMVTVSFFGTAPNPFPPLPRRKPFNWCYKVSAIFQWMQLSSADL